MNNEIESLKSLWQDSRSAESDETAGTVQIIEMAKEKMKRTVRIQLRTLLILLVILAILCAYFIYGVELNQAISRVGAFLMTAGVALRVLIECISIYLSAKIDPGESVCTTNKAAMVYHRFRKAINGPVTVGIILLYSVGFYMLTPSFSLIFNTSVLVLIDLSYIVIAFVFIWFIRKTVKKEMIILQEIIQIQHDLIGDEP